MTKNISDVSHCYGCGVCAKACSKKLIELRLNECGFYAPYLSDQNSCTNCGLCKDVCAFCNDTETNYPIKSYAAWSKNEEARIRSTSGGVSFEIGKYFINQGYKFCGVRYNPEQNRTEHYIADTLEELMSSVGSKYQQSYTSEGFRKLDKCNKYVVVGTPCQIASFRRYIKRFKIEENFILVDFFCHGVPSKLLWDKYVKEHGQGLGKIRSVTWRNKEKGWRKSYCITIEGENGTFKSWNGSDDFFAMFLGDACLNAACYDNCKFKYNNSHADIRIGDLWSSRFQHETKGVCAAVAFSEVGNSALRETDLHLVELPFDEVANGQMKRCAVRPWYYGMAMKNLQSENGLHDIANIVLKWKNMKGHINRIRQFLNI